MTEAQQVASIILSQLGGQNRLAAMLGAHSFAAGVFKNGPGVSFKIQARAKGKIQSIIITLNASDLYDVEFGKVVIERDRETGITTNIEYKVVDKAEDIYNDSLKEVIERRTGLYLSL